MGVREDENVEFLNCPCRFCAGAVNLEFLLCVGVCALCNTLRILPEFPRGCRIRRESPGLRGSYKANSDKHEGAQHFSTPQLAARQYPVPGTRPDDKLKLKNVMRLEVRVTRSIYEFNRRR